MTLEKQIQELLDGNGYPENVEREKWDTIKELTKTDVIFRKAVEEWIKLSFENGGDLK